VNCSCRPAAARRSRLRRSVRPLQITTGVAMRSGPASREPVTWPDSPSAAPLISPFRCSRRRVAQRDGVCPAVGIAVTSLSVRRSRRSVRGRKVLRTLQGLLDPVPKLAGPGCAARACERSPPVHHQQRRQGLNFEALDQLRRSLDVDPDQLRPACERHRKLLEERVQPPGRRTPRAPEVNDERDRGRPGDVGEIIVGRVHNPRQRAVAAPTARPVRSLPAYSVLLPTTLAAEHADDIGSVLSLGPFADSEPRSPTVRTRPSPGRRAPTCGSPTPPSCRGEGSR
jgi:hypothetical protein